MGLFWVFLLICFGSVKLAVVESVCSLVAHCGKAPLYIPFCNCRVLGIRIALIFRKAKYRIVELDGLTVKEMAKKRAQAHNRKLAAKTVQLPSHHSPPGAVIYSRSKSERNQVSIVKLETSCPAEIEVTVESSSADNTCGSVLSVEVATIEVEVS